MQVAATTSASTRGAIPRLSRSRARAPGSATTTATIAPIVTALAASASSEKNRLKVLVSTGLRSDFGPPAWQLEGGDPYAGPLIETGPGPAGSEILDRSEPDRFGPGASTAGGGDHCRSRAMESINISSRAGERAGSDLAA